MAAVMGTREAMSGAHASFISSTYWTESVGPVAALATLKKMRERDLPTHVAHIGNLVKKSWQTRAQKHNLPVVVGTGYPCLAGFKFDSEQSREVRTLYTQLMLERGLGDICCRKWADISINL
jgi:glutamate-1-semialdehyde 2,1-aminomutase